MKQKILRILPFITTALIMLVIFLFSSQSREDSSQLSTGITMRIIGFFMDDASLEEKKYYLDMLHHIIRKCAHFTLYALLGFSAAGMFVPVKKGYVHKWIYTIIFCVLYAASDELHQSFVDGRGAMIRDVVLDSSGSCFGAAVFLIILFLYRRRKAYD